MNPNLLNLKILIVDDIKVQLRNIKKRLLPFDHELVCTTDPYEALEIVKPSNNVYNPFDLVLADYFMPGISGVELGIRIMEIDPSISIAIITIDNSDEVYEEILASPLQAKGIFRKAEPFSIINEFLDYILSCKQDKLSGKQSLIKERIKLYSRDKI